MDFSSDSPMLLAKRLWFKSLIDTLIKKGYKKTQIAEKLKVSPQRLTNIINGSDALSDKFIDSLVNTFNLGSIQLNTLSQLSVPSLLEETDDCERVVDRLCNYIWFCGLSEEQATVNARLDGDFLTRVREEGRDLSEKESRAFLKVFPDLNEEWLLTGHGNMRNGNTLPFENRKEPMARILELLNQENVSLDEFAQVVNSNKTLFNNAIKWPNDSRSLILGNDKAIKGWVDAFCSVFPKYSKFWILTGKTSKYNYPPLSNEK